MSNSPSGMEEAASNIVSKLQSAGYEALFAGGCVRDRLLGKVPKDYDIATSATPDQILELYPRGDTIGAHFGVILLRIGGFHFEVATFREDGEYSDGRRPDTVTFSTSRADSQRRDFTVNGLFFDPVKDETIDYVKGRDDLEAQMIRAIGNPDERFEEDYLRMLRAIRFATVLGFEIEAGTFAAICKSASRIGEISPERIREELDKIWMSPNRLTGFDLLVDSGLMAEVLPEILVLQGCEQPPQWHPEGDVFVHTRLMISLLPENASLPLVLSVLFHDIAKPATFSYDEKDQRIRFSGHDKLGARMAEDILKRLRYSNTVIDAVREAVDVHMKFKDVQKMKKSTLKRFMARENFDDELALHKVDCGSSNRRFENYDYILEKRAEFESEPLIPKPFLSGADLLERNWEAGPAFGKLLREAQDLQLEGTLASREEALDWLDKRTDSD